MTKDEVLETLAGLFKRVNAVDPNLSTDEIGRIELPKLAWFEQELALDPDFKKEVLFSMMVNTLKKAHPHNVPPEISPQDKSVFDKEITVEELSQQIAEDTPDEII